MAEGPDARGRADSPAGIMRFGNGLLGGVRSRSSLRSDRSPRLRDRLRRIKKPGTFQTKRLFRDARADTGSGIARRRPLESGPGRVAARSSRSCHHGIQDGCARHSGLPAEPIRNRGHRRPVRAARLPHRAFPGEGRRVRHQHVHGDRPHRSRGPPARAPGPAAESRRVHRRHGLLRPVQTRARSLQSLASTWSSAMRTRTGSSICSTWSPRVQTSRSSRFTNSTSRTLSFRSR